MDSPRGRIYLMGAGARGRADDADSMVQHFDACLGCMACVTACPSGVQYDKLIESTRAQVERRFDRPHARQRAAHRDLQRLPVSQAAARHARTAAAVPEDRPAEAAPRQGREGGPARESSRRRSPRWSRWPRRWRSRSRIPDRTRRARAGGAAPSGMLLGCVQREFFPGVNAATARVLAAEGFEVARPRRTGLLRRAVDAQRPGGGGAALRPRAHRRVRAANGGAGVDHVVVNSAGCGSSMKEYADLLADDDSYAEQGAGVHRTGARRRGDPRRGRARSPRATRCR